MVVHKVKINTNIKKEEVDGEWDFVKGGVEENESDLKQSILRELWEETGSFDYNLINQFDDKICFDFPISVQAKLGYESQETTMFHFEYSGDIQDLKPIDDEINMIKFIEKQEVLDTLTHEDTRAYFTRHFMKQNPS